MVTLEQMREGLERRFAERGRAEKAEASRLRAALPEVVSFLRQEGATRVWLFGSLARDGFRHDSDVDLAVEGLEFHAWLRASVRCTELLRRQVDLVRLEDAPPTLAQTVLACGERLS